MAMADWNEERRCQFAKFEGGVPTTPKGYPDGQRSIQPKISIPAILWDTELLCGTYRTAWGRNWGCKRAYSQVGGLEGDGVDDG